MLSWPYMTLYMLRFISGELLVLIEVTLLLIFWDLADVSLIFARLNGISVTLFSLSILLPFFTFLSSSDQTNTQLCATSFGILSIYLVSIF
jgi:hypothetical protein